MRLQVSAAGVVGQRPVQQRAAAHVEPYPAQRFYDRQPRLDPPHAQSCRDDFAEAPHLDHAVPVRHRVQRGWRRSGKVQLRVRHVLHDEDAVPGADLHQLLSDRQRHRRPRRVVVVGNRVQQLCPPALRRQPFQGLVHALGEGVILAQVHLDDLAQVPSHRPKRAREIWPLGDAHVARVQERIAHSVDPS